VVKKHKTHYCKKCGKPMKGHDKKTCKPPQDDDYRDKDDDDDYKELGAQFTQIKVLCSPPKKPRYSS